MKYCIIGSGGIGGAVGAFLGEPIWRQCASTG